jgi:hypothetical protein
MTDFAGASLREAPAKRGNLPSKIYVVMGGRFEWLPERDLSYVAAWLDDLRKEGIIDFPSEIVWGEMGEDDCSHVPTLNSDLP